MALLREQIVSTLKGQTLKLPNISNVHRDWPTAVNPHLPWIREEASERLREITSQRPNVIDQDKTIKKLVGADFGLFAATWWPFESIEILRLTMHVVIWLFLWDDEIDSHDSRYGSDLDPAETYRKFTLTFVAQSLGLLTPTAKVDDHALDHSTNVLITSFQSIADAVAHRDEVHRARLYHEIEIFVNATATEQHRRLCTHLPSAEEYMECRMGTSAVGVLFALVELPIELLKNTLLTGEMRKIELEANIIISIINDIVSLKKELAAGTPDSLIPILWQSGNALDTAMVTAMKMMLEARQRFDEAESRLKRACPHPCVPALERFLTVAKTNCTGNVFWSLKTQRYGFDQSLSKSGEICIKL